MKLTGIIAEYNSFHSGYESHINKSKELTGSDFYVVIMSGDFVQRGEPAAYSKYLRIRTALAYGTDLVVEMPPVFAVSSAEDFAACSVALLIVLGAVDTVCFGSEDGSIQNIQTAAALLADESPVLSAALPQGLRRGLSWPQVRDHAPLEMAGEHRDIPLSWDSLNSLLGSPNNLSGIEYRKAIIHNHSSLRPVTVKRSGQGYHDQELEHGQASASALRSFLIKKEQDTAMCLLTSHVSAVIFPLYREEPSVTAQDLSNLLDYALLFLSLGNRGLSVYADPFREMASRPDIRLLEQESREGRIRQPKTRQYIYTRVSHVLFYLLLGITDRDMEEYKSTGYAPCARILGSKKESKELLSVLKKRFAVSPVIKTADASRILSGPSMSMLNRDIYASHVRQSILVHTYGYRIRNEYTQSVCVLQSLVQEIWGPDVPGTAIPAPGDQRFRGQQFRA